MKKLFLFLAVSVMAAATNAQQAAKSIVSAPDYRPGPSQSRPFNTSNTSRHSSIDRATSATATYSDTLVLTFVYGADTGITNMPIYRFTESTLLAWYGLTSPDTALWFPGISWDTATNTATNDSGAVPAITYTETLTEIDTSVTYWHNYVYPVHVSVPAGNFAAMTLTFKSGSTNYPSPVSGDSITSEDGVTFYQGSFQPAVAFVFNGTAVQFPFYEGPEPAQTPITADMTTGYFKTEGATDGNGWSPLYVPNWAYDNSTGGAYYLQYPDIWFHIQGGGWYDYVDSVFNPNITLYGGAGDVLTLNSERMWNDTSAIFGYGGTTPGAIGYGIPSFGYSYNVSTGLSFQPFASDWPADQVLSTTTAYIIDSVSIVGIYGRPAPSLGAPLGSKALNHVSAVPNPATDIVTISFDLTAASAVTISLSDMLGQVVATQTINGTAKGSARFSTSALPPGVYIYTLNANGERSTGHVVITH